MAKTALKFAHTRTLEADAHRNVNAMKVSVIQLLAVYPI